MGDMLLHFNITHSIDDIENSKIQRSTDEKPIPKRFEDFGDITKTFVEYVKNSVKMAVINMGDKDDIISRLCVFFRYKSCI